jgi:hypothetical protein
VYGSRAGLETWISGMKIDKRRRWIAEIVFSSIKKVLG